MGIVAQPGSNQIEIVDEIYRRLESIKKEMPADIVLEVGYDRTTFVRKAIFEVKETLIIAISWWLSLSFYFSGNGQLHSDR